MLPVSVCIIARNEQKHIEECMKHLIRYEWEIVLTDTGSADDTVSIAEKYTPHIYSFPWNNDFSAAKNFCISKASHDLILVIDCDEYVEPSPDPLFPASLVECFNPEQVGMILCRSPYYSSPDSAGGSVPDTLSSEYIGRFFNRRYARFEGTIHEQLVPSGKNKNPFRFVKLPLSVLHMGYSSPSVRQAKADRNLTLLMQELETHDNNPYVYFQIGQSYFGMENYEKARHYLANGLSFVKNKSEDYVHTMVESYGYSLLYLKKYAEALILRHLYDDFCHWADFLFLMGLIYMNNSLFDEAIAHFERAAVTDNYAVEGVNSYLAYYNIGTIYECTDREQLAMEYYTKCGTYRKALERLEVLRGK